MIHAPDRAWLIDDAFGEDKEWLYAFCRAVEARHCAIPFTCTVAIGDMDHETARLLRRIGCHAVWFDAGSGSLRVLERMKQRFTPSDTLSAAHAARGAGIEVGVSVTVGYPSETAADVEATRTLLKNIRPDHCRVSVAYPYRGSELYREVQDLLLPWYHAGRREEDDLMTFRNEYSQNFCDVTCGLLRSEARRYGGRRVPLRERLTGLFYRFGYAVMRPSRGRPAGGQRTAA
jgi:radical SAM superfamily enzyme YgiQ (UPF0313 family)